jgi:hypothetical protein
MILLKIMFNLMHHRCHLLFTYKLVKNKKKQNERLVTRTLNATIQLFKSQ